MSLRVAIHGWGSEGDLRPLVALAARLRHEGHSPSLVFTPVDGKKYDALAHALDVPLRVVPESMQFSLEAVVREAKDKSFTKLSQAVIDRAFTPYVEAMYEAACDSCRACDVVVGGSSSWYAKAAALEAKVPFATVQYYPGIVPSRVAPPLGLADWGIFNGLRWTALRLMFDMAFRKAPAKFFADHGLPPIRHAIPDVLFSGELDLLAASPALCPPPADWAPSFVTCGEFFLADEADTWSPSRALAEFLNEGAAPVLVTLGSMEHMAPERACEITVGAARASKLRTIVQSKLEGASERREGETYFLPWAPHWRLFPSCAAIVHHGGAGTTHATLRAGKPSIVLPFIPEQRLWGSRLAQVGASEKPISFWNATPDTVAASMHRTVATPSFGERARELGDAMKNEDGASVATRALEALVGRSGRG